MTPRPSLERVAGGIRAGLPVVLGYAGIGFAAGVVERTVGMSIAEIALMATLLYAGAAQFVAAGMLGAASPPSSIILTVFLVNLRHLLLSASLAPALRRLPAWQNLVVGAQLTDETFAVASSRPYPSSGLSPRWMVALNLSAYLTWALANVAGGLFGQLVPDPRVLGLDFALAAMFAALLVVQLRGRPRLRPGLVTAVVAGALAVGIQLLVPGNWSIIVATLAGATIGTLGERWR